MLHSLEHHEESSTGYRNSMIYLEYRINAYATLHLDCGVDNMIG